MREKKKLGSDQRCEMEIDKANSRLSSTAIVAEKYPLSRAALAALLVGDGYEVFQSDNANSAILSVEQTRILPRFSQTSTARLEIAHPAYARRSAEGVDNSDARRAIVADDPDLKSRGIRACLPKPIVYPDLQQVIRSKGGEQYFTTQKIP